MITTLNSAPEIVGVMVGLLLTAAIVLAFCRQFKLPFTVTLVVVGMIVQQISNTTPAAFSRYFDFGISPDIILYVCLPTLIFESAFNLDARQLQRNLFQILTLAIPGLLLSTFIIGTIVSLLTPISFIASLLLGAILSATDPVAVIALFKQLGAPKRLTVLIEGESLFNDATSFVTAKLIFGIMIAGVFTGHQMLSGLEEFCIEFFGGIAVGGITAVVVGFILGKVDADPEIEISLTTILAYLSFMLAQNYFHASGVMATLTAGLIMSRWRFTKISPSVVRYLDSFWEFLAYVANAVIFLIIGLSANLEAMYTAIIPLIIVILAMLVSRAVIIFGLVPITGKLPGIQKIDWRFQSVMYWGGLRGAIALAIILSLPKFEHSELFLALVTGTVLFTLIVKGLSIEQLVNRLGLNIPPLSDRLARKEARAAAKQTTLGLIPELQSGGFFSAPVASNLAMQCSLELKNINHAVEELREKDLSANEEEKLLFLRCLAKEKSIFYDMFVKGHISERAQRFLSDSVEARTDALRYGGDIQKVATHTTKRHKIKGEILALLDKIPLVYKISGRLRRNELARDYSAQWSYYQGADAVLDYLEESRESHTANNTAIDAVSNIFKVWRSNARKHLDSVAEQFPEFVASLQERYANRLILIAELNAYKKQAIAGLIPGGVAEKLEEDINKKIRSLRETPAVSIELDPNELLRKVNFFHDLSKEDFNKVAALLHSRVVAEGETIIKQGSTGESLFIIMRGVIRVSREMDDESHDLATLMAGDFFGEMALLLHEKRNATCRAVTPCALYEIRRSDFDRVKSACPAIQMAIDKALKVRQTAG